MEMTELEKVIKGLHDARRYLEDKEWSDRGASPHIDAINNTIALMKEQEEALEQMRLDNTDLRNCNAELLKEQEEKEGHWIVLEFCANEGIYCSKCMNKIFDRSTKPKKKLSNYCPNCGSKNTHFFNPSTEKIMYSD